MKSYASHDIRCNSSILKMRPTKNEKLKESVKNGKVAIAEDKFGENNTSSMRKTYDSLICINRPIKPKPSDAHQIFASQSQPEIRQS